MHGLIALYLGYFTYLIIFLRHKTPSPLYKKITILLTVKILLLTILYFSFFDNKITKKEREETIQEKIL